MIPMPLVIILALVLVLFILLLSHRKQLQKNDLLEVALKNALKDARTDELTQLYNRKVYGDIKMELQAHRTTAQKNLSLSSRIIRTGLEKREVATRVGVVAIDLDGFKGANDTHGHSVGDQILKSVAEILGRNIEFREDDYLTVKPRAIRQGGDEFVLIVNVKNENSLKALMEKILHSIRQNKVNASRNEKELLVGVTASIGGTLLRDDDSLESVLGRADEASYIVKKRGRDGYELI